MDAVYHDDVITKDEIMTIPEVAEYLRLGESTVYRLVRDGELPAFRVGGKWRFHRKRLEHWIEQETERHLLEPA